jgi:ribosomal protein S6--L-glutamate ligase
VLKLLQGTQGVGVILAETHAAASSTLDALWALGQDVLIQEYVVESAGRDVRALVVGGRIVAAMRRQARSGEWRSNIHRGGEGTRIELDPSYVATAIAAAGAIGLDVAGVDLLEGRDGPRVTEVNASPGFEGLERVCGVDVAAAILDHAEAIAGLNPDAPAPVYRTGPQSQETEFR